jgi:transglutaminase-like putative cysteine protease
MQRYLATSKVVDWKSPSVLRLARELAVPSNMLETVNRCFEWVRDEVRHSTDFGLTTVTCIASDVLERRTGFCYAKSHLLAALLRANGVPTGFCYQRLLLDETGQRFCLHGLNAVHLGGFGWYRVDARGNTGAIQASFCPPVERLAYAPLHSGECDIPGIYPEPFSSVVTVLTRNTQVSAVSENLPDWSRSDPFNGAFDQA